MRVALKAVLSLLWMVLAIRASAQERSRWQLEWNGLVKAASNEAQVNVYIAEWGAVLDAGVFERSYPGTKVKGVALGRSGDVFNRLVSERRAGKYLADVVIVGSAQMLDLYKTKALEPIKAALVLPEVVDESKWWQGRHRYVDHEGLYMFRYGYFPNSGSVFYNSTSVEPKDFKSLWDFLSPKWKGKIIAQDPLAGGPANASMRFFYHHPELGPVFIKRFFGEMDVTLFRDRRQGTDWLAVGKFPLCFFCNSADVARAHRQGLPVAKFEPMKEGAALTSRQGIVGLVNRAPHPNAAKVFVNWFLSREGQITLLQAVARAGGNPPDSLRIDIPKDDVLSEDRRIEGVKYIELDVPGKMEMEPILKIFRQASVGPGKG